jgi:hypothetical protein
VMVCSVVPGSIGLGGTTAGSLAHWRRWWAGMLFLGGRIGALLLRVFPRRISFSSPVGLMRIPQLLSWSNGCRAYRDSWESDWSVQRRCSEGHHRWGLGEISLEEVEEELECREWRRCWIEWSWIALGWW